MGMTKPLGVMGIEVTIYHDISRGLEIIALSDDTASTTEQDDDGERYKKNMKVVECRSARRKHIRLENSPLRNRQIALNINTKAVQMPSILAMEWQVARQLEFRVLDVVM